MYEYPQYYNEYIKYFNHNTKEVLIAGYPWVCGILTNTPRYDSSVTGPSKMVRIHSPNEDYRKASSLSSWLFMKYDMSYKTYRNKAKARKDELRAEYNADTENDILSDG